MYSYIIQLIILSFTCILSYFGRFDCLPNGFENACLGKNNRKGYIIRISKGNLIYIGLCIYLILFSGFRFFVGTDYWAYYDLYNGLVAGSFYNWHYEWGFWTLTKIIAFFRVNYVWYFSIISAIIVVLIAKTIRKRSPYPIFSITLFVFLYFFYSSFNIPRQFIASAIIVSGSVFILEKKLWKYVICVALATLFHTSAILFIGLYFIGKIKINSKTKITMIAFAVFMLLFGERLSTIILSFWPQYSIYIGYESGSAISDLIIQVALLILLEMIRSNVVEDKSKAEFDFYYSCNFFAIIMSAMAGVNVLFARMEAYFYIFSIFSIPFGIYYARKNKTMYYLGFFLLGIVVCVRYLLANNCGVVPYNLSPLLGL